MDFEFIIPLTIDGLQEASSSRHYSVAHVSSAKEIPQRLQECIQSYRKDGPQFILDQNCFDSLYSVLINFKNLEEESLVKAWELMVKVMTALSTKIYDVLDTGMTREYSTWLMVLKMNTYIACNLTEAFESSYNKPKDVFTGKKGRKATKSSESGMDWEEERVRMLVQLYSLAQNPLNRLWDPPIMDEDFVNLIANCCYKILETSSMNLIRTKNARDSIFQIIGTLVKKFNHGLACALKLMQLLQHFEHLIGPCAQGVILLIDNYDAKGVLQEMIREVSKIDSREIAKDSSGLRNYSQFFVEVSEKKPEIFIPSLSLLVSFLQQEPYCMRNCVLYIMGSIVLRVLKGENLDSKSKALRDECLSYLQEFIHDVNSFVRSKVLQIWEELIEGQAVPLSQQQPILKKIVQRLRDKSSNVRKYALHLLAAFLKANPFAAKLPLDDLKKQFEDEMKILEEMKPGSSLENLEDEEKDPGIENQWMEVLPKIIGSLKKLVKNDSRMECSDEDDDSDSDSCDDKLSDKDKTEDEDNLPTLPENFTLNEGVSEVGKALLDSKAEFAVHFLMQAMDQYPNEEVLKVDEESKSINEYQNYMELSERQKELITILHRIFTSFMKMKIQMEEEKSPNDDKAKERRERKRKEEEYKKQKMLCVYLRDSVNFAREIHKGLPDICQLLASRQITDTMEAIDFFVTAFEFGVLDAMTGVRKMLNLIWSKEQTVKDAVVSAYRRLYINVNSASERAKASMIVQNLTALITGATLGELASLEEIVSQFLKSGDINKHCITLLWEKFTKTLPNTSDEESKSALILITMASNSESSIISSNLNVIIEVGLGERAHRDFALVKYVCLALCKMAPTSLKTDDPNPPFRFPQDHEMFHKLSNILREGIQKLEDNKYCPMAVEAINAIYLLAEHPDLICGTIIQDIIKDMKEKSKTIEAPEQENFGGIVVPMPVLARFITVVGQVALRQLIHMDTFIFTELKRRNFLREKQEQKTKQKARRSLKRKDSPNLTSASEINVNKSQEGDIDEEMGLTGAVADDMEAEFIRNICETETVKGDNLLSALRPLIVNVCSNPSKYSNPKLRTAAGLALAKFMLVSSECCEENLQLLFTILEKSKEPVIRANTIIAVGDLTFRFPNLVEPWTSRIYARLRDDSTSVRRNTLTVLTHLILNDQVKVKGQISEIALCLTDEDLRIAALTKLFFGELAKKGNALYNVLPDIISRLSDTEVGTTEKNFRVIMSYIFSLIVKDRQLEAFVEKLCNRLESTVVPRQWRDLTYCLSLLPYTEKGIRKLSENFSCYADKLHEEQVFELLSTIIANAKKFAKMETKTAIEELESRLEDSHKKGVEDENAANKAFGARMKAGKKAVKTSRKKRESSSDADDSEDFEERVTAVQKGKTAPVRRLRRSCTLTNNSVRQNETSESEMSVSE